MIYKLVVKFFEWTKSARATVLKFYYPFAPVLNPDLVGKL